MKINGHAVTMTKRTTGEYGLHFDNQFAGDFPLKSAAKQAGRQMAENAAHQHISVQDAVKCEICNPNGYSFLFYNSLLAAEKDPKEAVR